MPAPAPRPNVPNLPQTHPPPPLEESLLRLYARIPLGIRLGLEPMRDACARMGHPERAFPAAHIAGTNGKGSVCAMVESIARTKGSKTGLYTSPNLCRFAERIRIEGEPIDDASLSRHIATALDAGLDLSFFEVATLAAFLAFREAAVDLAVIEVGIGGRLDATNVIPPPRASAITRIALDHTDRLGSTLVEIAREKAGIAKRGMDLVIGPTAPEVRAAIDEIALANGATTTSIDCVRTPPRIGLAGEHQRVNARIAAALGARLGASSNAIDEGIARVKWPGRLEWISARSGRSSPGHARSVLLDAAHNADGAETLAKYLGVLRRRPEEVTLVFGALADKDWGSMLDVLAPLAAKRIYVSPASAARGSVDPNLMPARYAGSVARSIEDALALSLDSHPEAGWRESESSGQIDPENAPLVVVAGSIVLVGRARGLLLGLSCDGPVGL